MDWIEAWNNDKFPPLQPATENRAELCRDRLGALRAQMLGVMMRQRVRTLVTQLFKTTHHLHPPTPVPQLPKKDGYALNGGPWNHPLTAASSSWTLMHQGRALWAQVAMLAHGLQRVCCYLNRRKMVPCSQARFFFFFPFHSECQAGPKGTDWIIQNDCLVQRCCHVSCIYDLTKYGTGGPPKSLHRFSTQLSLENMGHLSLIPLSFNGHLFFGLSEKSEYPEWKTMHAWGENVCCKTPGWDWNPGLSCCKAAMSPTAPLCKCML